eukprot:365381-Chlamydomonas_euryale.AAC.12
MEHAWGKGSTHGVHGACMGRRQHPRDAWSAHGAKGAPVGRVEHARGEGHAHGARRARTGRGSAHGTHGARTAHTDRAGGASHANALSAHIARLQGWCMRMQTPCDGKGGNLQLVHGMAEACRYRRGHGTRGTGWMDGAHGTHGCD